MCKLRILWTLSFLVMSVVAGYDAMAQVLEGRVQAGGYARDATPICTGVELPPQVKEIAADQIDAMVQMAGRDLQAQLDQLKDGGARVWWILPKATPNEDELFRLTLRPAAGTEAKGECFVWRDEPADRLDLLFSGRPVLRYMYAYDPERRVETYKPYHHLFDSSGERVITKGPGGLYPHHRALFIGWNKLTFKESQHDLWHMKKGDQRHKELLALQAGPVFGRSCCLVHWNDPEGKPLIGEERQVTFFRQPEGRTLVDFLFRLTAPRGDVYLNGDKNHGGFQFRAHNEVSERQKETYYIFPPPGQRHPTSADTPWAAMSFALGDKRFTAVHMNHPGNPTPTEYSADRKYGRFGSFFKHTIKQNETLELRYRVLVFEGEVPTPEYIEARYIDFIDPPSVRIAER